MEEISQQLLDEFEFDMLKHRLYGFKIPTDNEYEIMDTVSKCLKDNNPIRKTDFIEIDSAIEKGILSMSIFSKRHINKLMKIIFYTYGDLPENDFRAMIEYGNNKFKVREIMIPEKVNQISPIWIGHECIHCLKDTNYDEYINKDITSEVITLFYEILSSHTIFEDVHDAWKYERLKTLLDDKYSYLIAKNNLGKDSNDVYRYIMYSYGQYLTSYFYALNLYSLYKQYPKQITKYINKVLNHKKITLDLLNEFEIRNINKENVNTFIFEHNKL